MHRPPPRDDLRLSKITSILQKDLDKVEVISPPKKNCGSAPGFRLKDIN